MEAENTNVAASKKNANVLRWRVNRPANGSACGIWDSTAERPLNSAAATGIEPYDVARVSPFASVNAPFGTRSGTLASRAGRKNNEIDSWTNAITYSRPMPTNGARAMRAARVRSHVTMIVRRYTRSATTPPTGAAKIGGAGGK